MRRPTSIQPPRAEKLLGESRAARLPVQPSKPHRSPTDGVTEASDPRENGGTNLSRTPRVPISELLELAAKQRSAEVERLVQAAAGPAEAFLDACSRFGAGVHPADIPALLDRLGSAGEDASFLGLLSDDRAAPLLAPLSRWLDGRHPDRAERPPLAEILAEEAGARGRIEWAAFLDKADGLSDEAKARCAVRWLRSKSTGHGRKDKSRDGGPAASAAERALFRACCRWLRPNKPDPASRGSAASSGSGSPWAEAARGLLLLCQRHGTDPEVRSALEAAFDRTASRNGELTSRCSDLIRARLSSKGLDAAAMEAYAPILRAAVMDSPEGRRASSQCRLRERDAPGLPDAAWLAALLLPAAEFREFLGRNPPNPELLPNDGPGRKDSPAEPLRFAADRCDEAGRTIPRLIAQCLDKSLRRIETLEAGGRAAPGARAAVEACSERCSGGAAAPSREDILEVERACRGRRVHPLAFAWALPRGFPLLGAASDEDRMANGALLGHRHADLSPHLGLLSEADRPDWERAVLEDHAPDSAAAAGRSGPRI